VTSRPHCRQINDAPPPVQPVFPESQAQLGGPGPGIADVTRASNSPKKSPGSTRPGEPTLGKNYVQLTYCSPPVTGRATPGGGGEVEVVGLPGWGLGGPTLRLRLAILPDAAISLVCRALPLNVYGMLNATYAIWCGVSPDLVKQTLGNSSLAVTNNYTKANSQDSSELRFAI
jgi:hypothetical protein